MAAKHSMPEVKEGGVNVTPLIDIVMCLIIFFMLVAKIGVKTGEESTISPAETIVGTKLDTLSNTCTLNIRNLDNGGNPTVTVIPDDSAAPREISMISTDKSKDSPLLILLKAWKAAKGEDFRLILKVDADTPFKLTKNVYAAVGQAGIVKIAFQQKQVQVQSDTP